VCHLTYYRANQIEVVYVDFSDYPTSDPTATVKYITTTTTTGSIYGQTITESFHASATVMGQNAPL